MAQENNNSRAAKSENYLKAPPVIKIINEDTLTPVSSGAEEEDDDVQSFSEMLRDDPTWQEPHRELAERITTLLDMYFSDENLLKDKFLLKHVKRNRLGYVSVKLLTSFKKLKSLSKSDWKLTAFCISKSDKLVLNKSGTKVRRKDDLPDVDLPITSVKTILYKLGNDVKDVEIDELSSRFKTFGKLNTIRKIGAGKEIPLDLRNHTIKHPELGNHLCVVVEYDTTQDAQNAYKTLSKEARSEGRSETFSLLGSGRNPKKQAAKHLMKNDDYETDDSYISSRENSPLMRRRKLMGNTPHHNHNHRAASNSPLVTPNPSREATPERRLDGKRRESPQMTRKQGGSNHSTPSGSPWMQRKSISPHNNNNQQHTSSVVVVTSPAFVSSSSTPEASPRSSPIFPRALGKHHHHHAMTTSPLATALNLQKLNAADSSSPSGCQNHISPKSTPWLERRNKFVSSQGNSPASTPGPSPSLGGRKFANGVPIGVTRLPRGPPTNLVKGFTHFTRTLNNQQQSKKSEQQQLVSAGGDANTASLK